MNNTERKRTKKEADNLLKHSVNRVRGNQSKVKYGPGDVPVKDIRKKKDKVLARKVKEVRRLVNDKNKQVIRSKLDKFITDHGKIILGNDTAIADQAMAKLRKGVMRRAIERHVAFVHDAARYNLIEQKRAATIRLKRFVARHKATCLHTSHVRTIGRFKHTCESHDHDGYNVCSNEQYTEEFHRKFVISRRTVGTLEKMFDKTHINAFLITHLAVCARLEKNVSLYPYYGGITNNSTLIDGARVWGDGVYCQQRIYLIPRHVEQSRAAISQLPSVCYLKIDAICVRKKVLQTKYKWQFRKENCRDNAWFCPALSDPKRCSLCVSLKAYVSMTKRSTSKLHVPTELPPPPVPPPHTPGKKDGLQGEAAEYVRIYVHKDFFVSTKFWLWRYMWYAFHIISILFHEKRTDTEKYRYYERHSVNHPWNREHYFKVHGYNNSYNAFISRDGFRLLAAKCQQYNANTGIINSYVHMLSAEFVDMDITLKYDTAVYFGQCMMLKQKVGNNSMPRAVVSTIRNLPLYATSLNTCKMYAVECGYDFELIDNGKFEYKTFPPDFGLVKKKLTHSYRTVFSPTFVNTSVEYENTTGNITKAVIRQLGGRKTTCTIENGVPEMFTDADYRTKQKQFSRFGCVRDFVKQYNERVSVAFDGYDLAVEMRKNAYKEHKYRRARITAYHRIIDNGGLLEDTCMSYLRPKSKVAGNMKRYERVTGFKKPRLVNDLGTEASLVAGTIISTLKDVMSEPIVVGDCRMTFIAKPSKDELHTAFSRLFNPVYKLEYIYFSDDSAMVYLKDGVFMRANVDIASCDASHTEAIFHTLRRMVQDVPIVSTVIGVLIEQLKTPLRVGRSVYNPLEAILYSGTVLTTLINNIANCFIAMGISGMNGDIVRGARRAGYQVTVDEVEIPEDYQFLKHSPTFVDGALRVYMNLGVLLRVLGQCRGDLPGRGSIETRGAEYTSGIASTFKHSGNSLFLSTLTRRFNMKVRQSILNQIDRDSWYHASALSNDDYIPASAYEARYGPGYQSIVDFIAGYRFGDCIQNAFTNSVFSRDYGLNTTHPLSEQAH